MAAGLGIGWGINWGSIALSAKAVLDYLTFKLNFNTIATDFTFTRNSFATRVNEFGLIETVTNLGSDLIENGSFDELGSELVTNGDFENGTTNWQNPTYGGDNSATLSIDNGSLKVEKNADLDWRSSFVNQTPLTFTDGKTYKITYSLKDGNTSGADVYIRTNFDRSASTVSVKALTNDWVEYTDYYVADSSAEDISFGVLAWQNAGNGQYYFIDNVSVKQVDPNDDWLLNNTVWKIGDGVATADGTANGNLQQVGVVPSGTSGTYKLEWTQEITSGTRFRILPRNGNNSASTGVTFVSGSTTGSGSFSLGGNCVGSGTFTVEVETTAGFTMWFIGESGNTGTIDNVSVVEVIEDDVPRIDYTGSTFDIPVLGDELVVNGDFATDTNWIKQSGWSIANGVATFDINDYVSGNTNIYQTCMVVGKEYVLTFDIVDYVQGTLQIASMNGSPQWSGNGTKTVKFIATQTRIFMNASVANNTILNIDNVSVKEVTAYTTTDKGAFLLEPISTNLIDYSEDIEGSNWTTSGIATTTDVTTSPDGTQNADLIDSVSNGSCFISDSTLTFTIGNTYTFSVFAKKGNNDWIRTAHVSSATNASWFDLENGVVGTVNGVSGTIEDFGNGWYKCTNTFVATQATGGNQVFIGICDANGSTDAGASGQNDYVWGMQVEELSYATSYIPTSGTTVTRAQESCVDATPTINSLEGVLYAEISALVDNDGIRLISLNDGTSGNIVQMYYSSTANKIVCQTKVASSTQSSIQYVALSQTDIHKIAFKYKENDFALWVDGIEIGSDTSGSVWAEGTLNQLDFNVGTGSLPFYGNTKDLKVYDKALTDDELTELTTI